MIIAAVTNRSNKRGELANGVRVAMALQRLGHSVKIVDHAHLDLDVISDADLVLAFGTLLYPGHVAQAQTIRRAIRRGSKFALWYFDACNPAFRHSLNKVGNMKRVAPYLDHLLMTDHSFPWERYAKRFTWLMQGVDRNEYEHATAPHESRRYDVIFTGTKMACFSEREAMLRQISRMASLRWIGANASNCIWGLNLFMAYQSAKVAFVPPPASSINDHYWSNRLYLAAGTGTPCLVGYTPGIEDHYVGDEEVIYFHNDLEMKTKLLALLGDTDLRKRIGDAGRARTMRDHTYDNRAQTLLNEVMG
jgi:hypothetical protein